MADLPEEQQAVLEQVARKLFDVKTRATGPDQILHHYITGEELGRIEHAAKRNTSPWLEFSIGAVIGNVVPTITAIAQWTEKGSLRSIDESNLIVLICQVAFIAATIAFGIMALKSHSQSVASICSSIRKRPPRDIL